MKKKLTLANGILIALIGGILFGMMAHGCFPVQVNDFCVKWILNPVSNLFVRGIKMIAAPMVLFSLICGAASLKEKRTLGRVSWKILSYCMLTTVLAAVIALLFANLISPGIGISVTLSAEYKTAGVPFIMDAFANILPSNPFESLAKGEMLQIIIFAVLFGLSVSLIGEPAKPLLIALNQANEVMAKMLHIVMLAAPYGVFALIAKVIIAQDIHMLPPLIKYVFTILFVMLIQLLLVYGTILKLLCKVNPLHFFKKYRTVMSIGFSSFSSSAVMPVSLDICQNKLGVPHAISSLTLPLGTAVNMDGTAILQGISAIFMAQVFGIELSFTQQLLLLILVVLASISTTGMSGASMLILAAVLQQFGIPLEGIAILLPIERILDMCKTTVNVSGAAVGTMLVASSEKELDLEVYNAK